MSGSELDIAEVELGDKGALGGGGLHHTDAPRLVHGDVAAFVVVDAGLADGGGVVLFDGGEDEFDAGGGLAGNLWPTMRQTPSVNWAGGKLAEERARRDSRSVVVMAVL